MKIFWESVSENPTKFAFFFCDLSEACMAQSIRSDCFKISWTEVGINLEVNWLCSCDLVHFFMTKTKQDTMKCLF